MGFQQPLKRSPLQREGAHIIQRIVLSVIFMAAIANPFSLARANAAEICDPAYHSHKVTYGEDAISRSFHVYSPERQELPMPVVFAFHDRTEDSFAWADHARLSAYASLANVIIVAPVGVGIKDLARPNSEKVLDWHFNAFDEETDSDAENVEPDDIDLIDAIVRLVDNAPCTSSERYLMGHGQGAELAMAAACRRPTLFRKVGVVGSTWYDGACVIAPQLVPAMAIQNAHDEVKPLSLVRARIRNYALRNLCTDVTRRTNINWPSSRRYAFDCPEGAEVIFHELHYQNPILGVTGHAWPTISNSHRSATRILFEFFGVL